MFEKIKRILKNSFVVTFCHTFVMTCFLLILIVNNGNILTGGNKNERERVQRES